MLYPFTPPFPLLQLIPYVKQKVNKENIFFFKWSVLFWLNFSLD